MNARIYDKAVEWAKKRGSWAVFLMSLIVNPLHLPMTIAMASLKFPPLKFLFYSFLGVAIKSLILAFAGYFGLTSLLDWLGNFKSTSGLILLLALIFIAVMFAGFCFWQLMIWISETRDKNRKYHAALKMAEKSGKHLLVIGGPWGVKPYRRWFNKPAHPSGDVVLDIDRRALIGQHGAIAGSVTHLPFADKAFGAVFLSHVLEHLPDIDVAKLALEELDRVADGVFIVYPSRQSIGGWLTGDHHIWIWHEGNIICLQQRGKARHREKIYVETASTII